MKKHISQITGVIEYAEHPLDTPLCCVCHTLYDIIVFNTWQTKFSVYIWKRVSDQQNHPKYYMN